MNLVWIILMDTKTCKIKETINTDESIAIGKHMYKRLTWRQIEIVDTFLRTVNDSNPRSKYFFIYEPGATGKTSVHKICFDSAT